MVLQQSDVGKVMGSDWGRALAQCSGGDLGMSMLTTLHSVSGYFLLQVMVCKLCGWSGCLGCCAALMTRSKRQPFTQRRGLVSASLPLITQPDSKWRQCRYRGGLYLG